MISIALLSKGGYAVVIDGRIVSVHETITQAIRARAELEKQLPTISDRGRCSDGDGGS
jgi:hypothetical protein